MSDILSRLRDLESDLAANNVMTRHDTPAYLVAKEAEEEIKRLSQMLQDNKSAMKLAGNLTQACAVFFADTIDNIPEKT